VRIARERSNLARRELLILLAAIIPMVATAILASIMPKFASRYAIVAAPLLYLSLALLLYHVLWPLRLGGRLAYVALCAGWLLFTAPQTLSAATTPWLPQEDARGLAAYLTERAHDDQPIVLLENAPDAIEYYYRGAAPRVGMHIEFDFQKGADQLNQLLAKRPERVWVVLWHNEFADPTGMVVSELQRRSEKPPTLRDEYHDYQLLRFDLRDWTPVVATPEPQQRFDANFGDRLTFVGVDRLDNGPGALRWIMYWQARQPLDHDYSMALQLRDASGEVKLTHNQPPSTPYLSTAGFPPGLTLRGLTQVKLPTDLKPQIYDASVLVWDIKAQRNLDVLDGAGYPMGITVTLGKIDLTKALTK
jgi:hypothetical protein